MPGSQSMLQPSNISGQMSTSDASAPGLVVTQELVEKLADKVMELLLDDLRNDAERYRLLTRNIESRGNGSAGGR